MEDPTILMPISAIVTLKTLQAMQQAGLWHIMRVFASDQHWWYLRCQYLKKRVLSSRIGDWKSVYHNLVLPEYPNGLTVHTLTIEVLLETGYDPEGENVDDLIVTAAHPEPEPLLLLSARGWSKSLDGSTYREAMRRAAESGHPLSMEHLLSSYRASKLCLSSILGTAVGYDNVAVASILLKRDGVSRASLWKEHWRLKSTSIEMTKLLLEDGRLDPAGDKNLALKYAAQNGDYEKVVLYLADGRVDPFVNRSELFRMACRYGCLRVAQLLYEKTNVNTAVENNYALRFASSYASVEMVKWLLTLDRVNPLAGSPNSLDRAANWNREEILDLLLRDRRVSIERVADRMHYYLPRLRPKIEDRILGCCVASTVAGYPLRVDEVVHMLQGSEVSSREENSFKKILLYLVVKRPSNEEIALWIGEQADEESELAIRCTLTRSSPDSSKKSELECNSSLFTCYRALTLVLTGYNFYDVLLKLKRERATSEGVAQAARLVGAHLGAESGQLSLTM